MTTGQTWNFQNLVKRGDILFSDKRQNNLYVVAGDKKVKVLSGIGSMNCNTEYEVTVENKIEKFLPFGGGSRFLTITEQSQLEVYSSEEFIQNKQLCSHDLKIKENEEITAIECCNEGIHIFIAVARRVPNRLDYISVLKPVNGGRQFSILGRLQASMSFFDPIFQIKSDFYHDEYPIISLFEKNSKRISSFYFKNGDFKYFSKQVVINSAHEVLSLSAQRKGYSVTDNTFNTWNVMMSSGGSYDFGEDEVSKKMKNKKDCCQLI